MQGFAEHLIGSPPPKFSKLNNTGAQMQDSIYHMTPKLHFITKSCTFFNVKILPLENVTFLWMPTHNVTM